MVRLTLSFLRRRRIGNGVVGRTVRHGLLDRAAEVVGSNESTATGFVRDLRETFTLVQSHSVRKISRQSAHVDRIHSYARFGQERIGLRDALVIISSVPELSACKDCDIASIRFNSDGKTTESHIKFLRPGYPETDRAIASSASI